MRLVVVRAPVGFVARFCFFGHCSPEPLNHPETGDSQKNKRARQTESAFPFENPYRVLGRRLECLRILVPAVFGVIANPIHDTYEFILAFEVCISPGEE